MSVVERVERWVRAMWWRRRGLCGDDGMTTAEYAVGTVAAVGLATVLYRIVTGSAVTAALNDVLVKALHASF